MLSDLTHYEESMQRDVERIRGKVKEMADLAREPGRGEGPPGGEVALVELAGIHGIHFDPLQPPSPFVVDAAAIPHQVQIAHLPRTIQDQADPLGILREQRDGR